MPYRIITGLFDRYEDARRAVGALEAAGVAKSQISIVANNADNRYQLAGEAGPSPLGQPVVAHSRAGAGAGTGAALGGTVGGGAGLLAGLGVLAIPGIGPVLAVGWLVATAAGAAAGAAVGGAAGGLIGAMVREGVPEDAAHTYAEGLRRGGTLITVRAEEAQADGIAAIFADHNAIDPKPRAAAWRDSGWTGFDENAAPYSEAQIDEERDRLRNRPPV
jgi:hypothetical protein